MNLKEELQKLKNKLLEKKDNVQSDERPYKVLATFEELKEMEKQYYKEKNGIISESLSESFSESLNDKVDSFIKWYTKSYYHGYHYEGTPDEIRNFIEKMAVWYELRYPDYSLLNILYYRKMNAKNNCMFNDNPYINKVSEELNVLLDNNQSKEIFKYIEWREFYNTKTFINSLTDDEKFYLRKPKYPKSIILGGPIFELSSKGTITSIHHGYWLTDKIDCKTLEGKNIKEAFKILKDHIFYSDVKELEKQIEKYDNHCKFKNGLLDSIMYRIIERGRNRIGCYRAFLFAKEFNRNIDIPMQYGLGGKGNYSKEFIKEYLNAGGKENLICYDGYILNDTKKVSTIDLKEIIDIITKEELKERLVSVLANRMNSEELQQEKVKQLRLERKLEKSKK